MKGMGRIILWTGSSGHGNVFVEISALWWLDLWTNCLIIGEYLPPDGCCTGSGIGPWINFQILHLLVEWPYHSTNIRMAKITKTDSTKWWRGCGAPGALTHFWWECKVVEPFWKTIWQFPIMLNSIPTTRLNHPTPWYLPKRSENKML